MFGQENVADVLLLNILRDQIWQFVGVAIAIIGIILTIIVYRRGKNKKIISYEVVSRVQLNSASDAIKEDLKFFFKGQLVESLDLVLLKVSNSGNIPIRSEDVKQNISFNFGCNANVLSAEIERSEPEELKPTFTYSDNKVTFEPFLMNQGDSVELKIIVDNFDGIKTEGRVVGVKEIIVLGKPNLVTSIRGLVLTLVGFSMLSIGFFIDNDSWSFILGFASALGIIGISLNIISQIRWVREKQKNYEKKY